MALRKKTDAKVTSLSAIVTIAFYVVIAAVFWNVGGGEIIKEFVITAAAGRKPPPPPPPRRTPPKVSMKQPPKIRPKFSVVQPKFSAGNVRPDFGKAIIPVMDNEADLSSITRMAKMYDMSAISKSMSEMKATSLDIGSKLGFGLGDLAQGRKTVVVGTGKRIRAKLTLAKYGSQSQSARGLASIVPHLNAQTSVKVGTGLKQINANQTFDFWYESNTRRIRGSTGLEGDAETAALRRAAQAISQFSGDQAAGGRKFVEDLRSLWRLYLKEKYPLVVEKVGEGKADDPAQFVKYAPELYKMTDYEKQGLRENTELIGQYSGEEVTQAMNIKKLAGLYGFFRVAEMLNYPFIFGHFPSESMKTGVVGRENVGYMRRYLESGGFLYLDDYIYKPYHRFYRRFFNEIMEREPDPEEEALIGKTFAKLQDSDRKVSGYSMSQNTPNPFHPETSIPFKIPKVTDVTFKVYNRVGRPVRTLELKNLAPGQYVGRAGVMRPAKWNSTDDEGLPLESGTYFIQMSSGLYQETQRVQISELRMVDAQTHPIFTCYYTFEGTPNCTTAYNTLAYISDEEKLKALREYGTSAFAWTVNERVRIFYTEWAGILSKLSADSIRGYRARDFFVNVLVYAITQQGSISQRL